MLLFIFSCCDGVYVVVVFIKYMLCMRSSHMNNSRLEKEIDDEIRFGSSDVKCEVVASVWKCAENNNYC